jgi:hypothetical protein
VRGLAASRSKVNARKSFGYKPIEQTSAFTFARDVIFFVRASKKK